MKYEDVSVSMLDRLIDEWIFSERDRAILKRRLIDGLHYEGIAYEFGMATRTAQRIVKSGKATLQKQIKKIKTRD